MGKYSDESSLISILHSNFFLTNDMTNKPKERPFKNEFFRVLSFMYTFYHLLNVLSASQSDFSHVLSILYTLLDDFNSTNQYIGGFLLLLFFQKTNSLKIKVFSSNDQVEMCKDILNRTFQHCSQKNTDENELQNNLIFVLLTCYYEFYKQQPLSQNRTLSIQEVLCNIFQLLKRCNYNGKWKLCNILLYYGIHPLLSLLKENDGIELIFVGISSFTEILFDISKYNTNTGQDIKLLWGVGISLLHFFYIGYPIIILHTGKILSGLLLRCYYYTHTINTKESVILSDFLQYVASICIIICESKATDIMDDIKDNTKNENMMSLCTNVEIISREILRKSKPCNNQL